MFGLRSQTAPCQVSHCCRRTATAPRQPPILNWPAFQLVSNIFDDAGQWPPNRPGMSGIVSGIHNAGQECYVISAHQMLLGQPGIGRVIRDHQCADCCDELYPCLTGALKQTVAAQLEGCTTIDAVAAALGTSVTRDAKTGKLCSDDAGYVLKAMLDRLASENGQEAVRLQQMPVCRECSPYAPLTISEDASDSIHWLTSEDAQGAPYRTLEASLRDHLWREVSPPRGHRCQSLQGQEHELTRFMEVPSHLYLVIQRANVAEAQLTCPMRLDISEHCTTRQHAKLLLNAAVLFRQPGHYMTIVRGHGQQQGWWLALNDSLAYWVPDALVQSIMEEGLLAYAVQYVQEGPDMSSHLELLRYPAPIGHSSDLGGAKLQQQFEDEATTMVFRAAMRRLLQEDALRGLRADLRQFNRGAVMSEAELAYLLGALSASPELGLDPAEVQQYVKAAFEEAQQEAAHLPSSFACSAASAAADPFSSKVPLQPLQRVDSGTASSSSAAFDFDRMAAQGGPCDFGGAFQEQASSWANTAWPDSAGVEDPAGSHYSSSSSAAELPGSPFQQLSPSASLCGLAPAAGDEELPEVFKAAITLLLEMPKLDGLLGPLTMLREGHAVDEGSVAAILSVEAEERYVKADVAGAVRHAFRVARQHIKQPGSDSAAGAAAASFSSGKVPLQPLHRADSGMSSSPIAALRRGQDMFEGGPVNMEPPYPLERAPSGASTVGWQDTARVGSPASSCHSSGSAAQRRGGLPRQLSPSAAQLDAAAALADAADPGSIAGVAGETGTRTQVHLDADIMAQVQAGLGWPTSAAASEDWRQSGSRSIQDDLYVGDSLDSAWGSSAMGSQATDSDMGSSMDAEEELEETPGTDGSGAAQGHHLARDHLATKATMNTPAAAGLGSADLHDSLAVPVTVHLEAADWQGSPAAGAAEEQLASRGHRASLPAAREADNVTVLKSAGAVRPPISELPEIPADEGGAERPRSHSPVLEAAVLGATARPEDQRSGSDEAQSVGSAAPQLTAAEVLEASCVETDRCSADEDAGSLDEEGQQWLRSPSPALDTEAPRGAGAGAVMEDVHVNGDSAQAVPREVPQLGSEEKETDTLQNNTGKAPVRRPATLQLPDAGGAVSTSAAAVGPEAQAGPGSHPAAEAAVPSPAQWAAAGADPASVGSTAEEEPVQRMQPASDLADGSSEGDSSAVAVEQPRGSRHGTATLPGCSDAAQPAALVQPDVCSLEDADTDLQARQGSYAEAEAVATGVMEAMLANVDQSCIETQQGLEEGPAAYVSETEREDSEEGGYSGDAEDNGSEAAQPPPQQQGPPPAAQPQAASSPAAAKGFVARTAEAVATGAGTAAGAATIAYRLVGGAAVGVWRGAAILAGRGCQAATPAAAGGSTCLSWVADALTRRQQACSQAAADLLGSCPRDFWAAGEAVVLGAVGAAVGAAVGVAAAPFRRADAVLKAAGAACRRLLSRVGLAGRQ